MATDGDLKIIFEQIDRDKSGTLSLAEIRIAFLRKGFSDVEIEVSCVNI